MECGACVAHILSRSETSDVDASASSPSFYSHRSKEALRAARKEGCPGEEGGREGGAGDSAQRAAP